MTETRFLARFATIANAAFNSMSANSTAITSMSIGGHNINSTAMSAASNTFTIGTAAFFVANGNFGVGNTTPNARLAVTGTANISGNVAVGGIATFNSNVVLGSSGLSANGQFGAPGQVLTSNGTATYWAGIENALHLVQVDADGNLVYDIHIPSSPNESIDMKKYAFTFYASNKNLFSISNNELITTIS